MKAAKAKKQRAMARRAAAILIPGASPFRKKRLSVTNAPKLSSDSRIPVEIMPSLPCDRGSSKNKTPCEQDTKKGSR
ncbi:hypothetical protein D3C85_1870410 [compost metagenome]